MSRPEAVAASRPTRWRVFPTGPTSAGVGTNRSTFPPHGPDQLRLARVLPGREAAERRRHGPRVSRRRLATAPSRGAQGVRPELAKDLALRGRFRARPGPWRPRVRPCRHRPPGRRSQRLRLSWRWNTWRASRWSSTFSRGIARILPPCCKREKRSLGTGGGARRGLIHRDIKPANVFSAPTGRVKILDFWPGSARASVIRTDRGRHDHGNSRLHGS